MPDANTQPELPADDAPISADPEQSQAKPPTEETDPKADAAVDDIMKTDGDEALQFRDEIAKKAVIMKPSILENIRNKTADWWNNPRKRFGALGVLVVLAVLFALPVTRYSILGLVLKAPATITVVDSKTGAGVSGATVTVAGVSSKTDAYGHATIRVHVGKKKLLVSKSYYRSTAQKDTVTLSANSNNFKVPIVAIGRQVSIKVVNKITGKPVPGAEVNAKGATAKTNATGLATIVMPSGANQQAASITLAGYNTAPITISAAADVTKNTFSVTPAGKLYFLSNLSGKIDVVKTNLDGTDRQTVLAGTGSEDPNSTSLLASRDWKYLALLSKRSGTTASVYLIDTTNGDKLTTVDEGAADFSLVGWSGDRFVYQVTRTNISDWQTNQQALKSLDATTGQTLLLDQTQGSGTNANDYLKQTFYYNYLIGNQLVYAKNWQGTTGSLGQITGKQAELDTIGVDGTGHKVVKGFTQDNDAQWAAVSIAVRSYEPDGLYIDFSNGGQDKYFKYDDGTVTADSSITSETFYQTAYATYLLSPSGNSTFWSEQRDGKNTLLTGDADAKNQKQVATLSDYNTYGWYTDNYVLVSKSSSELYIMSSSGGTPLKITDYYKPAINYSGYGGGYGGL